ncbi:MAG: DNA polymerase IV [Patescibacteria group bacterium]
MRIIGHLDMDAFFAAAEEREKPWLTGAPIVVGADPKGGAGRGVVSTANYKAREYGIRSALPISKAWRLSETAKKKGVPPALFLSGNFPLYAEISRRVMAIIAKYSPVVEVASVDEAYFDLSQAGSFGQAEKISRRVKKEILKKEQLTASIGIGPNKLIAKIASDFQKPDGLTVVPAEEAEAFLEPMALKKIPGIGPKTEQIFLRKGIKTVRGLKQYSREELASMLGKWGRALWQKARGEDNSPLETEYERKSIGEESTFEEDVASPGIIVEELVSLSHDVFRRFARKEFKTFRTVAIKVRFADFVTKMRAHTLKAGVSDLQTLQREALKLFLPFLDRRENPTRKQFRLIGVRIEKLDPIVESPFRGSDRELRGKIVALLSKKEGKLSLSKLSQETGGGEKKIKRLIHSLAKEGFVQVEKGVVKVS